MQEATSQRTINEALSDLEQVLQSEREALLSLDATSIDELTQRKTDLESELSSFRGAMSPGQQNRLRQIKLQLRNNLVLLIHARDHIQARLGIEQPPIVPRLASKPAAGGTRLNLRG